MDIWKERARTVIQDALEDAHCTYGELSRKLREIGEDGETERAVATKIHRGSFSAAFLLKAAMVLRIKEIPLDK